MCSWDSQSIHSIRFDSIRFDSVRIRSQHHHTTQVWQEKDAAISLEFDGLVPENHAFRAQLVKIFRRKIKRSKKRGGDEDDGDANDDDDFDEVRS